MYKDTATIRIGVIYGQPVKEHNVEVTVFEHLGEAVEHLGDEKMLEYINWAHRVHTMSAERRKFIIMHEGPEKRRQVMREKNKA